MTGGTWRLRGFLLGFDQWCADDNPPAEVRIAAIVNPDIGLPYWFAQVPQTVYDDGRAVVCSLRIDEELLESVCDHVATPDVPI